MNESPKIDEPQIDWSNLNLNSVPKQAEIDYCNEFQDNQTVYETNYDTEPRTEEERTAQEVLRKQEAEEAKEDDKVLANEQKEVNYKEDDDRLTTTVQDDQTSAIKKELPFEFKYILKYTEKDDLERVKKCIERYPHSINARDSDGYTPIHRACHNDNVDLVKFLIDNNANVESKTNEGWRAIHCAAYWGNLNVLNFLIKYGVNLNALTNGNNTCLHFAVQRYERKLIELLIYHPLMYLDVKNGSNDNAYELCKRKTENYELFHNILDEDAY